MKFLQGLGIFSKFLFRYSFAFVFLFLVSCSSLFYYPSRGLHFPPQMIDAKPEDVWIPIEGKGQVHAWYFPQNVEKKSHGVVIYFHGNSGNITSHFLNLYWIRKYGFDLLAFDYRGFGLSTFNNTRDEVTRISTIEDGIAAMAWAVKQNPTRPLIIFGQSLGGAVAPQSIYRFNDRDKIKLLFLDSTFHSYRSEMSSVMSNSWITWPFQWIPYLTLTEEYSSKDVLAEMKPIPTVVMHGSSDQVVSYKWGRKVFSLLKEPKEFWHIEEGNHTDAFWSYEGIFRKKFIKRIYQELKLVVPSDVLKEDSVDISYSYELPYAKGQSYEVLQGRGGSFSHQGAHKYAIDFEMPKGTDVCAARDGVVNDLKDGFNDGGPQEKFLKEANYVVIAHSDSSYAEYYHLDKGSLKVKIGDRVKAGDCFAKSGQSGYSATPHLHFMVFVRASNGDKKSIPTVFNTNDNQSLILRKGQSYTR